MVLTSRSDEYAAAVQGNDLLTNAAGIELADLGLPDLVDYLPRTTRRTADPDTPWEPVLAANCRGPPGQHLQHGPRSGAAGPR